MTKTGPTVQVGPDRHRAVAVLPQHVGKAVTIEIAGADDVPARPGLAPTTVWVIAEVPFISQIAAWPSLFCHRMSAWPSLLKSPVPMVCQLDPGLPRLAAPMMFVPSISQIAASPLEFCHRMSAKPSALKSPVALTCQLGPGLPRLPPTSTLVPFSSQIPGTPLEFCHSRSEWPVP